LKSNSHRSSQQKDARQLVTCGLGGAYLSATREYDEPLLLPPEKSRMRGKDTPPLSFAVAEASYPSPKTSKRLAWGLANPLSPTWLPRRNPGFGMVAGAVHMALFLALSVLLGMDMGSGPIEAVRTARGDDVLSFGIKALVAASLALLVPYAFRIGRAGERRPPSTAVIGVLLQIGVALAVLAVAVWAPLDGSSPGWLVLAGLLLYAFVLGWAVGSEAFALYVMTARSGEVHGWQMSGQSIEEQKGFIRMHIADNGDLTLYPLVVDTVCHDWKTVPGVDVDELPAPLGDLPVPRLIEPPITIARQKKDTP
jgi:hypothetical protein